MRWLLHWSALATILVLAHPAAAQSIRVSGGSRSEASEGGKKLRGYAVTSAAPLSLHIAGPGLILIRARALGDAGSLSLTLTRDGSARSVNQRSVAPSGATLGADKLSSAATVELQVPAGEHDYQLELGGPAFVQVGPTRKSHPELASAAEEPVAPAAVGLLPPVVSLAPEAPRVVDAHEDRASAPAPGNAGEVAAHVEAPANSEAPARFILTPVVGFGFTVEDAVGESSPQFELGADARYDFSDSTGLFLTFRDHSSSQLYLTNRPDLATGGAASLQTNEQLFQADLDFVYTFHPLERLSLGVFAGPGIRLFENADIPSQMGGIAPGGEFTFTIARDVDFSARASYLYNFMFQNPGSISVMGAPHSATDASAALGLKLTGQSRLRLAYEGEDDAFARSYRFYHSLAFLFDIAI